MAKKTTIRDVAKAANVSVATVSYVMNDRKDAKISEATRKKVLQVANLLNYRPNHEATSLSTGKFHVIGIIYHLREDSPSRNMEILQLVNLLAERFSRMKYNCLILSADPKVAKESPSHGLDGIIAIDLEESEFREMSGNYFIPILCLDMKINDFLFYQIYTNMEVLGEKARATFGDDFYLMTEHFCNQKYQDYIFSMVPAERLLIYSECDEKKLLSLKKEKVVVIGALLGLIMRAYVPSERLLIISHDNAAAYFPASAVFLHNDLEKKANLAMNIMLNALEKKFDVTHEYKV